MLLIFCFYLPEVQAASLVADSDKPPPLLRHAACEIAAARPKGPPRVLVLARQYAML